MHESAEKVHPRKRNQHLHFAGQLGQRGLQKVLATVELDQGSQEKPCVDRWVTCDHYERNK